MANFDGKERMPSVVCEKVVIEAIEAVEKLLATGGLNDDQISEIQRRLWTLSKMASIPGLISPNRVMLCLNTVLDVSGTALLPDVLTLLYNMHMTSDEVAQALELAVLPLKAVVHSPDLANSCVPAAKLALSLIASTDAKDDDVITVMDAVLCAFDVPALRAAVQSAFASSLTLASRAAAALPKIPVSIHALSVCCWLLQRDAAPISVLDDLLTTSSVILEASLAVHPEAVIEIVRAVIDSAPNLVPESLRKCLKALYSAVGRTLPSPPSAKLWSLAWTSLLQELPSSRSSLFQAVLSAVCSGILASETTCVLSKDLQSLLKCLIDGNAPCEFPRECQQSGVECIGCSLETWRFDRVRCLHLVGRIVTEVSQQCNAAKCCTNIGFQSFVVERLWTAVFSEGCPYFLLTVDTLATVLNSVVPSLTLDEHEISRWKSHLLGVLDLFGVHVNPSSTGRWLLTVDFFRSDSQRSDADTEAILLRIWRCYLSLLQTENASLLLDVATGSFAQPVCAITSVCDSALLSLEDGVFMPSHFMACESKSLIYGARAHALFAALLVSVLDAIQDVPLPAWAFEGERRTCVDKLVRTALQSWRITTCCLWLLRGRAASYEQPMPSQSRKSSRQGHDESIDDGSTPREASVILGEDILEAVHQRALEDRRQYTAKHKIGGSKTAAVIDLSREDGHDVEVEDVVCVEAGEISASSVPVPSPPSEKEYVLWFTPEGSESVGQWCSCIEVFMQRHGFSVRSSPDVLQVLVGSNSPQWNDFGALVMLMDALEVMIGSTDTLLPDHIGGRFWAATLFPPKVSQALLKFPSVKRRACGENAFDCDLPAPPLRTTFLSHTSDRHHVDQHALVDSWISSGLIRKATKLALDAHECLLADAKVGRVSAAVLEKRAAMKAHTKRLERAAAVQAFASEKSKAAESAAFRLRQGVGLAWLPSDIAPQGPAMDAGAVPLDDSQLADDDGDAPYVIPADKVYASRLLHVIGTQLWAFLHRAVSCVHPSAKPQVMSEICAALTGVECGSVESGAVGCFEVLAGLMCKTQFAHIAVWVCEVLAVVVLDSPTLLSALGQLAVVCLYDVKTSPSYRNADDGSVDLPLVASKHRMYPFSSACCLASFVSSAAFTPTLLDVSFSPHVEDALCEVTQCFPEGSLAPEVVAGLRKDASMAACFSVAQQEYVSSCFAFWQLNMLFRCVSYQPLHVSETAAVVLLCHAAWTVLVIHDETGDDEGGDTHDDDGFETKTKSVDRRRPGSRKRFSKADSGKEKSERFWMGLRSVSPDVLVAFLDALTLLIASLAAGCPLGVLSVDAVGGVLASHRDKLSVDELLGVRIPIAGHASSASLASADRTCVRLRRLLSMLRLSVSLLRRLAGLGVAKLTLTRNRIKQACAKVARVASAKAAQINTWRPTAGVRVSSKDVRPVLCDLFLTAKEACSVLSKLGRVPSDALSEISAILTSEGIDDPTKHVTDLAITPDGGTLADDELWRRLLIVDEATVPHWQGMLKDMQHSV